MNTNVSRMASPGMSRLVTQIPPMPTLSETCPDIVRRFPELRNFDAAMKRWRDSIKIGDSTQTSVSSTA
jgi:hypothetical protein